MLVPDANARQDTVLQHPGVELTGSSFGHAPLKDQTHPASLGSLAAQRAAQVVEDRAEASVLVVGVGEKGVRADAGLDLGATAENLLRLAGCHVLLVADRFDPTTGRQVLEALSEGVPWTAEALARLENVPPFARSFARRAIDDYASEQGYSQVTPSVMAEAREKLGV